MAANNDTSRRNSQMSLDELEPQRHDDDLAGTSDTSTDLVDHKRARPNTRGGKSIRERLRTPKGQTRLTDVLLAFVIVFVPMAGISLILLGLTFYGPLRAQFPGVENDSELPIPMNMLPPTNAYYTFVGVSTFLSVGSWSSTVAEAVIAPFTLMFSFFIAQMALRRVVQDSAGRKNESQPSEELRAILKTPYQGSWYWIKSTIASSNRKRDRDVLSTYLAGFGVLFAIMLTFLVIAGDQWLHYTTTSDTFRYYDSINTSLLIPVTNPLSGFDMSSYAIDPSCFQQSDSGLPCSLTQNHSTINVASPEGVYLLLLTGINRMTSDFQDADFDFIAANAYNNEGSLDQIITYFDQNSGVNHSILFNLASAEQYYFVDNDALTNYGLDYVATTTSMSTNCDYATTACRLANITDTSVPDHQLLYDCFPSFQGNLEDLSYLSNTSTPPPIEVVRGWNTSFYQNLDNGTQAPISLQDPLNPFTFSAVVDLNSFPFSSFYPYDSIEVDAGDVVNAGSDHLAFALNCTATIYDVSFSLVNGSIYSFNATQSDPQKAAIIRAPLQAGFGANYLYQQATFSTISRGALPDLMANAFSQAGLAGSAGAFVYTPNTRQRIRYDQAVTSVNKAALIFQATVCMLYAAVGLVIMIIGLAARRSEKVRLYQVELFPPAAQGPFSLRNWVWDILAAADDDAEDVKEVVDDVKEVADNGRERNALRAEGVLR